MIRGWIAVLLALLMPRVVAAQETRTEEISKQKAEKSRHLKPYTEPKAERYLRMVESALTTQPVGWYPYIGSVYTGGLLAAGPGYRWPFGDTGAFNIYGAWSLDNYRAADLMLNLPDLDYGRLNTIFHARYVN
ncbi:MAG TPA: hypothetical protein VLR94_03535, partial [Acidobacteriota bacterium]|nr:hypothetical protein [Acidobacteriota bacterium]